MQHEGDGQEVWSRHEYETPRAVARQQRIRASAQIAAQRHQDVRQLKVGLSLSGGLTPQALASKRQTKSS
jgi:hypothetical protein